MTTAKQTSAVPWDDIRRDFADDEVTWMQTKTFEMKGGEKRTDTWYVLYPYVRAEFIEKRLNKLLTPSGWTETYRVLTTPEGLSLLCRLGIWDFKKQEWVTREGGALFPTRRDTDNEKGFRQSFMSAAGSLAFRAAAVRFRLGVNDLEQHSTRIAHRSAAPFNREVVKFKIKDKGEKIDVWCERPKLSELRKR